MTDKSGPDGWRIIDDDLTDDDIQHWNDDWKGAYKQALDLSDGKRPFVLVTNGKDGAAVALPADVPAMMELLKKYGE